MMTVPPQLTSSLPSFSYPASFRHPPPASSFCGFSCDFSGKNHVLPEYPSHAGVCSQAFVVQLGRGDAQCLCTAWRRWIESAAGRGVVFFSPNFCIYIYIIYSTNMYIYILYIYIDIIYIYIGLLFSISSMFVDDLVWEKHVVQPEGFGWIWMGYVFGIFSRDVSWLWRFSKMLFGGFGMILGQAAGIGIWRSWPGTFTILETWESWRCSL